MTMTRPNKTITGILVAAAMIAGSRYAPSAAAQEKVIRAALHADVRSVDPFWTTQTIVSIHALFVYDTLFAVDSNSVPQPQMVGHYEISEDRKTYTFTLRDGLKFHDGSPVTTADVVASLKRWGARDGSGQRLMSMTASMDIVDDKTFRLVLNEPYGLVLESLGKASSSVPVIMRKKDAEVDPNLQITEVVGSGPFRFERDKWVPGSKVVYTKNKDYVPRAEPASGIAGGKVVKVDRIELIWMPDPQTAMSALINGEIDFYERPPLDFIPMLRQARGVALLKLGDMMTDFGIIRLNHLQPPFNNEKARQAMYRLVNQEDILRATIGNPEFYLVCPGLIFCGSPFANDAGSDVIKDYNPKKALQMLKEAGYKGEPITVLHATDHPTMNPATQVLIEAMRDAGVNLDIQAMDWGSVVSRRTKKDPPAQGGWNIFLTTSSALSGANPVIHTWIGGGCDKTPPGWPCDQKLEELRTAWGMAASDEERMKLAREIQAEAVKTVAYIPFGQWAQPPAYRSDRLSGIVGHVGMPVFWNIEKK